MFRPTCDHPVMSDQQPLFDPRASKPGPIRAAVDADAAAAAEAGRTLAAGRLALLRALADQLDTFTSPIRQAKPYAIAQLAKQYEDTYASVFADNGSHGNDDDDAGGDPFAAFAAGLTADGDPARSGPA